MCPDCAMKSVDALDYLVRSERHSYPLVDDLDAGIENQIVVCWLNDRIVIGPDPHAGHQHWAGPTDPEDWLLAPLGHTAEAADHETEGPSRLAQVDELVRSPWASKRPGAGLGAARVNLAVLSANKGRLVVRDWFTSPLLDVRASVRLYLDAVHIVGPHGDDARPVSIMSLLLALQPHASAQAAQSRVRRGSGFGNIARNLLRVAYLGTSPPRELLAVALRRLRNPDFFNTTRPWQLGALCAAIKLALFHDEEDARAMSTLDVRRAKSGYLCGRLLAVLERAQTLSAWNRSKTRLNTTIAGRYYGYAATTPAAIFTHLISTATTAHLPNVGGRLKGLMGEVMSQLNEAGGFPAALPVQEQAEFALGYYHQSAQLRERETKSDEEHGEVAEVDSAPRTGGDGDTGVADVNEGDAA